MGANASATVRCLNARSAPRYFAILARLPYTELGV